MSQKWVRAKQWDDEHLTGFLSPVKWVLRAFSSVRLAVVILIGISIYGTLASVPIGLLALTPTYVVYALTYLLAIGVIAGIPVLVGLKVLRSRGVDPSWRFFSAFLTSIGLIVLSSWLWATYAWPGLRYDALTGEGVRFFGSFADAYGSMMFRQLPGIEMAELDFYGWWPMKLMLYLFVANLVVATVRRIEFNFLNLGVLTVHTGIIVMAIGSIYYARMKQEGDVVLFNPAAVEQSPGRLAANSFYNRLKIALWVKQSGFWQQRLLEGVPRYNDYNLRAAWPEGAHGSVQDHELPDRGRTLSIAVPDQEPDMQVAQRIDDDLRFEVIGYASYAEELADVWVPVEDGADGMPVRRLELLFNNPQTDEGMKIIGEVDLMPTRPADRISVSFEGRLGIEYTLGMPVERWDALASRVPGTEGTSDGTRIGYALAIDVPDAPGGTRVVGVQPGQRIAVGGYTLTVTSVSPAPPFPIITPGYENASSSLAQVQVRTPDGEVYDRWIYHRFPEISQDLLQNPEGGQPGRRDADPSIKIQFLDLSRLQIYLDEQPDGSVRALARFPGGRATTSELADDGTFLLSDRIGVRLKERTGAMRVVTPMVVPEEDRQRDAVGTHRNSMLAVRITSADAEWEQIEWLPFVQYLDINMPGERDIALPDGRRLRMAFGRWRHGLPGFSLILQDFEMIPYPHGDVPRDFRSDMIVWDHATNEHMERSTSMNRPLLHRVPFRWRDDMPAMANISAWLVTRIAPTQYKISQSGWDQQGWTDSKARVERGEIERPMARWTILGIGNNPGIYVIALGAVLFSVGIPWAFYVKPVLLRRKRDKIKRELQRAAELSASDGASEPRDVEVLQ